MIPRLAPAAALLSLAVASLPFPRPVDSGAAPPAWFLAHLRRQMEGGGRTLADNAAYRSAGEPYEAYGIQWSWGIGRQSLRGRLFAVRGGVEAGDMWELLVLWHPGLDEARALQLGGDGTFAEGWMRPLEGGGVEVEQVFYAPDGSTREVRHEERPREEGGHVGDSFVRAGEEWKPDRSYTWLPAPEAPIPGGRSR